MKRVGKIKTIPISAISVLNSRTRNKQRFNELVTSVAKLGLKRPITVTKRTGDEAYELVCGEGRMKAYTALGRSEIPAILVDAGTEDCFLMSLVENLARCRHSSVELLGEVERLVRCGYKTSQIAAKLDFSPGYIRDIQSLLKRGEERLLTAVEAKVIPHTIAAEIAKAENGAVQKALLEAYAEKPHTSTQIAKMRRLVEQRHLNGKRMYSMARKKRTLHVSASTLVKAYRRETERQRLVTKKAELTQARLLFVVTSLQTLFKERLFLRILREESLDVLPLQLRRRLTTQEA